MSSHPTHDYTDPTVPPRLCLNCGQPLRGPYCSACGQHDVDYHRSFHHLTHDLLENLFHFEGKFFVTVAWLLAKPGKLTNEFVAGRRQSQLNPLRMYIFVSVLFFLGVTLLNHGHLLPFDRAGADAIQRDFNSKTKEVLQDPDLTDEEKEQLAEKIAHAAQTDGRIDPAALVKSIAEQRAANRTAAAPAAPESAQPSAATPAKPRRVHTKLDPDSDAGRRLTEKFASGELTISKVWDALEHRIPSLLFLGVPLFALLLKLFYIRSGRYYIEHLVFSLHLHTWSFLVLMVGSGYLSLAGLGPAWLKTTTTWTLVLWALWYGVSAFRNVYAQSYRKTLLKIVLLLGLHGFLLLLVAILLILGTIFWLALV